MIPTAALVLGILSASFFGSWHCAAMCGPIATLMSTRHSLISYHFGRLLSYSVLGALAGGLGQIFLNSQVVYLRWISSFLISLVLIFAGLRLVWPNFFSNVMGMAPWTQKIWNLTKKIQAFHVGRSGLVVGLLTALLPCGWLYTYVIAAIASQSAWAGALTLFLFWLGGLPALSAVPMMIRQTVQSAGLRQQKIAGFVLVIAGLYSVVSFMFLHSM